MWVLRAFVLCGVVSFGYARQSLHADLVLEYLNGPDGSRFSDNIYEDALLDVVSTAIATMI